MPERIDIIEVVKVNGGSLPVRPIDLGPGDWAEKARTEGGRTVIKIHRAGFWKRLWVVLTRGC